MGKDAVGNPHRARISRFELLELILLSKLDEEFPVERFEAAVSQSAVPTTTTTTTTTAANNNDKTTTTPHNKILPDCFTPPQC